MFATATVYRFQNSNAFVENSLKALSWIFLCFTISLSLFYSFARWNQAFTASANKNARRVYHAQAFNAYFMLKKEYKKKKNDASQTNYIYAWCDEGNEGKYKHT